MTDRHPHWVYAAGEEPDPRFSLANERTFLAWMRTVLGILAGAVALHTLGLPADDIARKALLLPLLALAIMCAAMSWVRWARVERAMRLGRPLPAFTQGPVLAGALVVIAVALGVVIML